MGNLVSMYEQRPWPQHMTGSDSALDNFSPSPVFSFDIMAVPFSVACMILPNGIAALTLLASLDASFASHK